MKNIGLYIHIPFCKSRCYYCNFTSSTILENIDRYMDALYLELLQNSEIFSEYNISTVYFGGGTPSIIDCKYIERIMDTLKLFNPNIKEATIEVNPGSVSAEKLKTYLNCGINRISIGLQSTYDKVLKSIGRVHTYTDFLNTLNMAKKAGINNISVDIMYPLPELNLQEFKNSINQIIALKEEYGIKHISVYNLEIHKGSKLDFLLKEGFLHLVDEDEEYKMKEYLEDTLERNSFNRYEISNFAINGYESKHNLAYWNQEEYIGIGASASSFFAGTRYTNTSNIEEYINGIFKHTNIVTQKEELDKLGLMKEYMILKLRLMKGVSSKEFKNKFNVEVYNIFKNELERLINNHLILIENDYIILTSRGKEVANMVWEEFI